jgi:hypothetical protein
VQCPNLTLCWLLLLVAPLGAANRCDLVPDRPPDRSYLTECRPEPVSPVEKAAVLGTLPRDGAITAFTAAQRAKLDAVGRVLHVLGRDNVYEVIVIDVPQAWTGLYERAVLLVSLPALDLLSATELQGVVAHEAGHEYLFREYEAARLAGDHARLREVETACDAVAVLTLEHFGVPAARFAGAIEKIYRYNQSWFGVALDESSYPALKERCRLVAQLSRRIRQH